MNVGSLFSGCGLLDYGLHLAGLEHSWFCEREADRRDILRLRWPGRPVYDDVRTVGVRSAARPAIVVGGFPCKGASTAGKREGFGHPETVLWREQFRIIRELRPRYAVVENVANILGLHGGDVWGEVLGDLDSLGMRVWWDCLPAAAFGAPHGRDRVFAVAYDPHVGTLESGRLRRGAGGTDQEPVADAAEFGHERARSSRPGRPGLENGDSPAADRTKARRGARERDGVRVGSRAVAGHAPRSVVEAFPWAQYEPAVRRWERTLGRPAPFPLVRRVDDGRTRRVERSRLSALGDGVLVQAGHLIGRMIMDDHASLLAQEAAA